MFDMLADLLIAGIGIALFILFAVGLYPSRKGMKKDSVRHSRPHRQYQILEWKALAIAAMSASGLLVATSLLILGLNGAMLKVTDVAALAITAMALICLAGLASARMRVLSKKYQLS